MNEQPFGDDAKLLHALVDDADKKAFDYFSYLKDSEFDDYDDETQRALISEYRRLLISRQRSKYLTDAISNNNDAE